VFIFIPKLKSYFQKGKKMILDMEDVDFIDSSGLGSLVAINTSLAKVKQKLIIKNCPENLMGLMKITNLDRILILE